MKILGNAFSLNMVSLEGMMLIKATKIQAKDIPTDCVSVIGHEDTARVVSGILGFEVPANRTTVTLTEKDTLYVAQYKGPRLPEGATELPEGATIEFIKIELNSGCGNCSGTDCATCGQINFMH